MNKFERKTYGQIIQDRQLSEQMRIADSWDFAKQWTNGMLEDVNADIAEHSSGKYKGTNFYTMAISSIEKIGQAPKILVVSSQDCPYPSLNQTVWKIDQDKQDAFLLWHLPSKKEANAILNDPQGYLNNSGNKQTMDWVFKLKSGALKELSDKENGYKKDMVVILQEA
jgi:hypothetical protein